MHVVRPNRAGLGGRLRLPGVADHRRIGVGDGVGSASGGAVAGDMLVAVVSIADTTSSTGPVTGTAGGSAATITQILALRGNGG